MGRLCGMDCNGICHEAEKRMEIKRKLEEKRDAQTKEERKREMLLIQPTMYPYVKD